MERHPTSRDACGAVASRSPPPWRAPQMDAIATQWPPLSLSSALAPTGLQLYSVLSRRLAADAPLYTCLAAAASGARGTMPSAGVVTLTSASPPRSPRGLLSYELMTLRPSRMHAPSSTSTPLACMHRRPHPQSPQALGTHERSNRAASAPLCAPAAAASAHATARELRLASPRMLTRRSSSC